MSDAEEYISATADLDSLGDLLVRTLRGVLGEVHIGLFDVPMRIKSKPSADAKLLADPAKYKSYSDLHDLLGLRVITLFEDDLDAAETAICEVLNVADESKTDKRDLYAVNQFGYRSRHYLGTLSISRITLPENTRFNGRVVEIQLRSLLQHAWAEIEHDLGYKPERPISDPLRRRFSQLAAVMELADEAFSELRRSQAEVEAVPLARTDGSVHSGSTPLTAAAVGAYIRESANLRFLDNQIATSLRRQLLPLSDSRQLNNYVLDVLIKAGWTTIEDVDNKVQRTSIRFDSFDFATKMTAQLYSAWGLGEHGLRPGVGLIVAHRLEDEEKASV